MTNKINTVDASFFTQRANDVNKKKVYHFDEEKGHSITYFPKFSKIKKDNLIVELIGTIRYCIDNNIEELKTEVDMYKYTYYLIIKHFTSLHDTLSKWTVEDNIAYFKALYDSGDFDLFFDEIFSYDEVNEVINMLKLTNQTANLYAKDLALRNKQIDEEIQSPILKDKLKKELVN